MLITTHFVVLVMIVDWHLSSVLVLAFWGFFSFIEGAYLSANLTKAPEGGWFVIAVSMGVALVKFVWLSGQLAKKKALNE